MVSPYATPELGTACLCNTDHECTDYLIDTDSGVICIYSLHQVVGVHYLILRQQVQKSRFLESEAIYRVIHNGESANNTVAVSVERKGVVITFPHASSLLKERHLVTIQGTILVDMINASATDNSITSHRPMDFRFRVTSSSSTTTKEFPSIRMMTNRNTWIMMTVLFAGSGCFAFIVYVFFFVKYRLVCRRATQRGQAGTDVDASPSSESWCSEDSNEYWIVMPHRKSETSSVTSGFATPSLRQGSTVESDLNCGKEMQNHYPSK